MDMKMATLPNLPMAEFLSTQPKALAETYYLEKNDLLQQSDCRTIKSELSQPQVHAQQEELLCPVTTIKCEPVSISNQCSVKSENSSTTSPGLTTELENFQDLTEWCQRAPKVRKMAAPPLTDELNTPVIEFGDFIFSSPSIDSAHDCYGLLNVKEAVSPPLFELDTTDNPESSDIQSNINNNKFTDEFPSGYLFGGRTTKDKDNCTIKHIKSETDKLPKYHCSIINDYIGGGVYENSKTTKNLKVRYNNNHNITAEHTAVHTDFNFVASNLSASDSTNAMIHQDNSTSQDDFALPQFSQQELQFRPHETISFNLQDTFNLLSQDSTLPLELQENFLISNSNSGKKFKSNLQLDFSNFDEILQASPVFVIDTPEVIDTALALENSFTQASSRLTNSILTLPSTSQHQPEEPEVSDESNDIVDRSPSILSEVEEATDEDEDYEPPSKKRNKSKAIPRTPVKSKRGRKPKQRICEDSNDSSIADLVPLKVRRGRPPKRAMSISSESTNADSEVSKYRELRDKNNEASRRSRLNKKLKDIQVEDEMNDLDTRNRKLRVRVEELERLVKNMRSNLMQILLKK